MQGARFTTIREVPPQGLHCMSACLFAEPEWSRRFPGRSFEGRYLARAEELREFLSESKWHLTLWVDARLLPKAVQLAEHVGPVDVHLVQSAPRFPFEQHLWRYLPVLLPKMEERVWHFRGMDDLIPCSTWSDLAEQLVNDGCDVLHGPCRQGGGRLYIPMRGKCSLRASALRSLRQWWGEHEGRDWSGDHWTNRWHADEWLLKQWFDESSDDLSTLTVKDRWLGPEFERWVSARRERGVRTLVVNLQHLQPGGSNYE